MPNIANISGTNESPQAAPVQPSSANPSVAGNIAQNSKTTRKDYEMSTQVSSMGELKAQAPEVYNLMMEGIATNIIIDMQHSQRNLEELWREGRSGS